MASTQTGARSTVLAALTGEPTSTSDLYDLVGYPALVRAGLVSYDRFRTTLVALERDGLAERLPGPDGTTHWRTN